MSKDIPFDPKAICDGCGVMGAYDFMGDFYCSECLKDAIEDQEDAYDNELD